MALCYSGRTKTSATKEEHSAMTFDIVETEIPATASRGRDAEPNPFTDHFPTKEGRALSVTIPGINGEPDEKTLEKLKRQARNAARALEDPKTARVAVKRTKTAKGEDTKSGDTILSVWTVNLILRPRGPKEDDMTDSPETTEDSGE